MNEAEKIHGRAMQEINNMMQRDKQVLKVIFPNGYKDVEMPIFTIAQRCSRCSARTLMIDRACIGNDTNEVALFCTCLKCNTNYIIYRKKNKINIVDLNYNNNH